LAPSHHCHTKTCNILSAYMAPISILVVYFTLAICSAVAAEEADIAPAKTPTAEDGQCDSQGVCSEDAALPIWTTINKIRQNITTFLECTDRDEPGSIVEYCMKTTPTNGPDCNFTDDTEGFLERRKACLYRCIFGSADLNMFAINNEGVAFTSPLTASQYRKTPFLDHRSLEHGIGACRYSVQTTQLQDLARWGDGKSHYQVGEGLNFVFHMGHTGSTLLSRALGKIEGTRILREPPLLSWLAESMPGVDDEGLATVWRSMALPWLSRRYYATERIIVKVKSSALRFLRPAIKQSKASKAIFMYSTLRTHLTICLARQQERFSDQQYGALDVKMKGAFNAFKEFSVDSQDFQDLSIAKRMALAWMKRMLFVQSMPKSKVLLLEMDDFLANPRKHLMEVGTFLDLNITNKIAEAIASDRNIFQVYAKDQEVPWDRAVQKRLFEGRSAAYRTEIDEGVEFAGMLMAKHKALQKLRMMVGTSD